MRLFMVRHGETKWNREGSFQGQMDIPLNETGLAQADRAAERFRGFPLEAVFVSPLSRARVTGEKIFAAARCENFVADPGLMEINHGAWEGLTFDEVSARYGALLEQWRSRPEGVWMPGPGGESLEDVQRRAVAALERTALKKRCGDKQRQESGRLQPGVNRPPGEPPAGVPLAHYWRLKIPNCSVSYVEFLDGTPQVGLLGDVSHLGGGFDSFVSKSL